MLFYSCIILLLNGRFTGILHNERFNISYIWCYVPGLQIHGLFFTTPQADIGKVVKTVCQRIFKKNYGLKV